MQSSLRSTSPAVVAVAGITVLFTVTALAIREGRVVPHLFLAPVPDAVAGLLPAALLTAGIVAALTLQLRGRDAGRSALVWLGATAALPVLTASAAATRTAYNEANDVWVGPDAWIGVTAALVTIGALATGAVLLGIPSGRRRLRTVTDPGPAPDDAGVPRALRRGIRLLVAGSVLTIMACVAVTALRWVDTDEYRLDGGDVRGVVVTAALVAVALAGLGFAVPASRGSRVAVNLVRAGAVAVLVLLWRGVAGAARSATAQAYADAGHPEVWLAASPAVLTAGGVVLLVVFAGALVAVLAGLAGLADPRTERYLRRDEPPAAPAAPVHSWADWKPVS